MKGNLVVTEITQKPAFEVTELLDAGGKACRTDAGSLTGSSEILPPKYLT